MYLHRVDVIQVNLGLQDNNHSLPIKSHREYRSNKIERTNGFIAFGVEHVQSECGRKSGGCLVISRPCYIHDMRSDNSTMQGVQAYLLAELAAVSLSLPTSAMREVENSISAIDLAISSCSYT